MRTKKTKKENGQHNPKRKKPPLPLWRKILRAIVALIVICFLGAFGFVAATVFTAPKIDNDKAPSVEVKVNEEQMKRKEFQELWKRINAKTYYLASFDSEEVIKRAITNLNSGLKITPAYVQIRTGVMETIDSKEKLGAGEAFSLTETRAVTVRNPWKGGIK